MAKSPNGIFDVKNKDIKYNVHYVIVINYCLLYAKYYSYLEKLKDKNKKPGFNVDFLGYLNGILKIEQNICLKRNQIVKFEKLNVIFENL